MTHKGKINQKSEVKNPKRQIKESKINIPVPSESESSEGFPETSGDFSSNNSKIENEMSEVCEFPSYHTDGSLPKIK